MKLEITVNGRAVSADVPPNTLLSAFIRDHLRLTGTHRGCDTSQCGACTVIANGRSMKSCSVVVGQMQGAAITTIEGLAGKDGELHPMQAAFKECHGLQCGFCTPGMIMSSVDLLTHHPHATKAEICELLEGNICRCTGYENIVKAVQTAQKKMSA
ncbi:MAG: (2Fe-2S)-binding protein [Nevskiaceae bacterium]|nr:MAG: (2Fe-2S)-binding protein [Nevskiaceae bacterium]TBR72548.1 MAG: (2Fe-2S)-binding protein [Nevskiaceae bacterium]